MQGPREKKTLAQIAHRARREFEAGKAVLPKGKVINTPVVTKLWVNGRASEDRDEWTEGIRAHCERKLLKYRPRGFEDRGSVVIDV